MTDRGRLPSWAWLPDLGEIPRLARAEEGTTINALSAPNHSSTQSSVQLEGLRDGVSTCVSAPCTPNTPDSSD